MKDKSLIANIQENNEHKVWEDEMEGMGKVKRGEKLKYSLYNDFIDLDGKHYLINYFTGNIIELDDAHYKKLSQVREGMEIQQNLLDEDEIDFLYVRGFLVEHNFDEKKYLKYIWKRSFTHSDLTLQIEPTLKCNFACTYCFEDGVPQPTMTETRVKGLLKFTEKYMLKEELRSLNVIWFGGEPLLFPQIIEKLTKGFREIFKKLEFDFETGYRSTLVTNGSLLNAKVINKLQEWRITNIQITIDGSEKVHNERRPLKGGNPSFHIVWKNFLNLLEFIHFSEQKIGIILRINFSIDVKDDVTEILDLIPVDFRKYIKVTYKHYFPKSTQWANREPQLQGTILVPHSLVESNLSYYAYQKGYDSVRLELNLKPFYCPSTTEHYFEISPDLKVYKCNVAVGIRPHVGTIDENGNLIYNLPEFLTWVNIDPFVDSDCLDCKLLPICMGGCGLARLSNRKGCIVDKEQYREVVKTEIRKMLHDTLEKEVKL